MAKKSNAKISTFLLFTAGFIGLLAYQNCGPSSENTLSVPGSRNSGSTGGNTGGSNGGNTQACGAGTYRPSSGSTCRTVSDTQYAPGDDGSDSAIECPQGASSAGTAKSVLADCKPLGYLKATPFDANSPCGNSQTEFSLSSPLYGCVTGLATAFGVEPQVEACLTITCARPSQNAMPPSTCQWVGFRRLSATQVNQEWSWESANNRFTTTTAGGMPVNLGPLLSGATGEPGPNNTVIPCNGNLRPWITTYWRRPDGGVNAPLPLCMGSCNP